MQEHKYRIGLGIAHTQQPLPLPSSLLRLELRSYRRPQLVVHLQCFGAQFLLRAMAQTMAEMANDPEVTVSSCSVSRFSMVDMQEDLPW